jgi:hypothetical protein
MDQGLLEIVSFPIIDSVVRNDNSCFDLFAKLAVLILSYQTQIRSSGCHTVLAPFSIKIFNFCSVKNECPVETLGKRTNRYSS